MDAHDFNIIDQFETKLTTTVRYYIYQYQYVNVISKSNELCLFLNDSHLTTSIPYKSIMPS